MSSGSVFSLVFLAGLFFLAVIFDCSDKAAWDKFKIAHNCKEIGSMDGSWDINMNYSSGKIGFRCDDGKEYWKNK